MKTVSFIRHARSSGADGLLLKYLCASDADTLIIGAWSEDQQRNVIEKLRPTALILRIPSSSRLRGLIPSLLVLNRARNRHEIVEKLIGGSLEKAILLQLFFPSAKTKYYLLSDLTRFHMSPFLGWITRRVEGWLISKGWTPCVTSPGFYIGYLKKFTLASKALLIHNNELSFPPALSNYSQQTAVGTPLIAWFGLLRCNRSLDLLYKLGALRICRIRVAGYASSLNREKFKQFCDLDYVEFCGEYQSGDLPRLYAGVTFTWACDWSSSEYKRPLDNSSLLLPNRFYQGIAARAPLISSKDSWSGLIASEYGIGIEITANYQDAVSKINQAIADDCYFPMVKRMASLAATPYLTENPWTLLEAGSKQWLRSNSCHARIFEAGEESCG